MPEIQELVVWVTVNGWRLEEFLVDTMDQRTCTCYIASYTESIFAIKVQNDLDRNDVAFRIFLDGSHVHTQLCEPGDVRDIYGVSTHPWGVKNFVFENIATTDDEFDLLSNGTSWDEYGLIEVRAYRVKKIDGTDMLVSDRSEPLESGPVHVTSKRAGCHRIALGEEVQSAWRHNRARVKSLDPIDEPYAKFLIRYRPPGVLQAQGIATERLPLNLVLSSPTTATLPKKQSIRVNENARAVGHEAMKLGEPQLIRLPEPHKTLAGPGVPLKISTIKEETSEIDLADTLSDVKKRMFALQDALAHAEAQMIRYRPIVKREPSPIRVPPDGSRAPIIIDLTNSQS